MNYLSVENLTKDYGEKLLFSNISFGVDQGQKIALVAKNGTGKTSLLNCLLGHDTPDSGKVVFRKEITVGYLKQLENFDPEMTVIDAVFETENKILNLIKDYEKALTADASSDKNSRIIRRDQ